MKNLGVIFIMENLQVKSKKRVAEHGEVFTNEREVSNMCDLVKQETERIDSRFLEPACGNGNFLAEILRRKLSVVKKIYGKSNADYEKYAFIAISSLYGVDILNDNVSECRERLYNIWLNEYRNIVKKSINEKVCEAIKYLLKKNILCGDALTLKRNDGVSIIFAEWSFITDSKVKRRDYSLAELLEGKAEKSMANLFQDTEDWVYDAESESFIPTPIRDYPLTDYWRVQENE